MNIRGKVAVITGAASGIGRATAIRLAREGAAVVAADIDAAGADDTATVIQQGGGAALSVRGDVAEVGDVQRLFDTAEQHFGGLDILCNNAGIGTGLPGYPQAAVEQWQRVLDVNLRAVILGTQLALPALRRRGAGVIVNTASMAAFVGFAPDPVYAATKAAVVMFTHSMGPLAASGIRVNCICPGLVNTPLLRRERDRGEVAWLAGLPMLEPEEIADGVVQVITDESLAGQALRIAVGMRDFAPLPELPMPQAR